MTSLGAHSFIIRSQLLSITEHQSIEKVVTDGLSFVLVNGLSPSSFQEKQWEESDTFWPEKRLLRDFPGSRIHLVGNSLKAPVKIRDFLAKIDNIYQSLDSSYNARKNSLVFLCRGIGGHLLLSALKRLCPQIKSRIRTIFFFGTALATTKEKNFKKALLSCAAVELDEELRDNVIDDATIKEIWGVLPILSSLECKIFTFFETKPSRKGTNNWGKSQKVLVTKETGSCEGSESISLNLSHGEVTQLSTEMYTSLLLPRIKDVANLHVSNSTETPTITNVQSRVKIQPLQPKLVSPPDGQKLSIPPPAPLTSGMEAEVKLEDIPSMKETQTNSDGIEESRKEINFSQQAFLTITLDTVTPTRSPVPSALRSQYHYLPLLAEASGRVPFFGREKYLRNIATSLQSQRAAKEGSRLSSSFAIIGPAGQGKTLTALMFASQHKASFPYILWVTADQELKLLQAFQDYAVSLGLIAGPSTDPWRDVNTLKYWLQTTASNFLLIFDNAEDTDLLNKFWPDNNSGSIIVTAQREEFRTSNVAGHGQYLEHLETSEALKMFQCGLSHIKWTTSDKKAAARLLKLVDNHPYGILVMISQINSAQCSLEDYSREYDLDGIFDEPTSANNLSRRYDKRLSDMWSSTIARQDIKARRLSELFALLDVDALPEKLLQPCDGLNFETAPYVKSRTASLKRLLGDGLIYKNEYAQQVGDTSLTTFATESTGRTFKMHRLTQKSVLRAMDAEGRSVAFASATALLCGAISPAWDDPRERLREQYRDCFTHVNSLHTFFNEKLIERAPVKFVELLWKASWLCYRKDLASYGLSLIKTGEAILADPVMRLHYSATELGFVRVELANNHACIATELGDFKTSLDKFQEALSCYDETVEQGENPFQDMREYTLYGGIANSLDGLGRHVEAEAAFRKCLELKPHDEEAVVYEINICRAMMHQRTIEKLVEASDGLIDYLNRLETKHGSLEGVDYLPGHAYYVLGNVRIEQGMLADAYKAHVKTVSNFTQTVGEHHHKTADAFHKLGWHQARLHQYEGAIKSLKKALYIYEGGQGKTYRKGEIARTTFKLGLVYYEQGDSDNWEEYNEKAQRLRKEILGEGSEASDAEEDFDQLVSIWAR